ncbi:MAG: YitT family protein [Clostridia bacterium]|nr:YitT family protein [Clostridia bacterium]MBR0408892.1 YitT family protein [Clostridia bacterium]
MGWLNLGTLLMAVGVYFFKFPNHFTTGGVSGISIVVAHFIPTVTTATLNLILNIALLVVGVAFLGKGFGLRTAYSAVVSSLLTYAFERFIPMDAPMTSQPVLELMFAVGLPAFGSAILFHVNASSGGTDIIAMLVKKYSHMHIGMALGVADLVVALAACFTFGMETGLFSLFGLFLKSYMVDAVMDNLRTYKVFQIVTDDPDPICNYIMKNLHHSATLIDGVGSFTHEKRKIIMTVINRHQAIRLQLFVRATDPHSFITITSSSEIVGKGFRGMSE